ncbi:XAP-5, putative [Ixodes scapularis]|uniref:Protein FAM50 homolog n=1 Tax=Ixodes scapularis TaxID=6945 RepID=B7QFH7_IXOSC|nr:XAP-5, putative [Ixodes scapularis]|eukprot:XP_002414291.1 XAP-5, putative [Ixodes scapularis]
MAMYKGAASEAGRAMHLKKKREKALEELELRKKRIEDELKLSTMENKFATHYDAVEQQLKSSTIGLVTLTEMKAKQEDVVKERERQLAQRQQERELQRQREIQKKREQQERQRRQVGFFAPRASTLFFEEEEEAADDQDEEADEEDGEPPAKRKLGKNPDVDTSFLPDRDREEDEKGLREELRMEWVQKQERLKNEDIEITFSYWDGSGHRRVVRMKKGNSVYQFLQKCMELLRKEFYELRAVTADQLMYVKEDLIIPHHYTFYDFIVTKARGKSGPLFAYDAREDVRLTNDASVEKEESHAGKVLLRSWYERNKHIFPASRWEPYDPARSYDRYTVSDRHK